MRAPAIARDIGDRKGEGSHFVNLSLAHGKLDDLPAATCHAESALKTREVIESPMSEVARWQLDRLL